MVVKSGDTQGSSALLVKTLLLVMTGYCDLIVVPVVSVMPCLLPAMTL